jgi:hypothetical protein
LCFWFCASGFVLLILCLWCCASGVVLPHGITNGQTYSWASSRDKNRNALKNKITGILETLPLLLTPHLRMEAESLCEIL